MAGARNQLYIWQGSALYGARDNVTEPHGHFACSIVLGLDRALTFVEKDGPEERYRAAVISPNTYHSLDATGTRLIALQIDPDLPDYRPLEKMLGARSHLELDLDDFAAYSAGFDRLFAGELDCTAARELRDGLVTEITHVPHHEVALDDRIRSVLRLLKAEEPDTVSVPELASTVNLSPDRFMHLFKENMGLPVRKYLLWLKLRRVARAMKDGANLTRAAHEAGFSDSAHLSRTFKDMFGMTPSYILANAQEVRVSHCYEANEEA